MKSAFFTSNPVLTLLIRNKGAKAISEKYLNNIELIDIETPANGIDYNQLTKDQKEYLTMRDAFPEVY